uniref:Uncharacterized protein n=1 Tax=Arundo donax TaxID=35708 RepID=A0A0A9C1Q6_ARUDO
MLKILFSPTTHLCTRSLALLLLTYFRGPVHFHC